MAYELQTEYILTSYGDDGKVEYTMRYTPKTVYELHEWIDERDYGLWKYGKEYVVTLFDGIDGYADPMTEDEINEFMDAYREGVKQNEEYDKLFKPAQWR